MSKYSLTFCIIENDNLLGYIQYLDIISFVYTMDNIHKIFDSNLHLHNTQNKLKQTYDLIGEPGIIALDESDLAVPLYTNIYVRVDIGLKTLSLSSFVLRLYHNIDSILPNSYIKVEDINSISLEEFNLINKNRDTLYIVDEYNDVYLLLSN